MKKIKGLFVVLVIIGIIVTFFSGFALATKVSGVNKFIGHVFIDDGKDTVFIMGAEECFFSPLNKQFINHSVQKTQTLEGIVEVNRKLAKNGIKGKKKKKDSGKKYRKRRDGDDDEDYEVIITEEEEEKNEEEQEQERKQEEIKKQEEEKRQEEERKRKEEKIKKEDWFR